MLVVESLERDGILLPCSPITVGLILTKSFSTEFLMARQQKRCFSRNFNNEVENFHARCTNVLVKACETENTLKYLSPIIPDAADARARLAETPGDGPVGRAARPNVLHVRVEAGLVEAGEAARVGCEAREGALVDLDGQRRRGVPAAADVRPRHEVVVGGRAHPHVRRRPRGHRLKVTPQVLVLVMPLLYPTAAAG